MGFSDSVTDSEDGSVIPMQALRPGLSLVLQWARMVQGMRKSPPSALCPLGWAVSVGCAGAKDPNGSGPMLRHQSGAHCMSIWGSEDGDADQSHDGTAVVGKDLQPAK